MKTRVVHIITMLELGGAQQNTLYTVAHLDRQRFSVALLSGDGGLLNSEARAIPELEFTLVPHLVREVSPLEDLKALVSLWRILRREKRNAGPAPLIVHTHSSKAGVLGRWAAFLARVPVIIHTFHGFGFNDFQPKPVRAAFILAEWLTGKITDFFISVSQANLERAVSLRLGPRDKMRVIRSGIELENFYRREIDPAAKRRELGIGPQGPVVTMVACLKPQKSPLDFARVAALVLKEVPEAWFVLCGDGELRMEMAAEVERLGLEHRFKMLGWRKDIPEILWISEALVLTSLWEGLPRVYPQAMAASLPIVGTHVDGAPEAVKDRVNGYLFAPHDVEGMATAVVDLLKDKERAQKMGQAGRGMVSAWDIREMVRAQEQLYEELVKQCSNR